MKKFLYFFLIFLTPAFWVNSALAQAPEAVQVAVPGDGQPQGKISAYGGEPILQYCRIDRHLSKTDPAGTVYFEFKACHPDNAKMLAEISWGDGSPNATVERVTCGRWRVPHLYKPGTYEANVILKWRDGQATCVKTDDVDDPDDNDGTLPGVCTTGGAECWFWPAKNGRCYDSDPPGSNSIGCGFTNYACVARADVAKCAWTYNGLTTTEEPCRFEDSDVSVPPDTVLNSSDKLDYTFFYQTGSSVTVACQFRQGPPPEAFLLSTGEVNQPRRAFQDRANFLTLALRAVQPAASLQALAAADWPNFIWAVLFFAGALGGIMGMRYFFKK